MRSPCLTKGWIKMHYMCKDGDRAYIRRDAPLVDMGWYRLGGHRIQKIWWEPSEHPALLRICRSAVITPQWHFVIHSEKAFQANIMQGHDKHYRKYIMCGDDSGEDKGLKDNCNNNNSNLR